MVAINGLLLIAAGFVSLPLSAMEFHEPEKRATSAGPSRFEEDTLIIDGFFFKKTIKQSEYQYVCTLEHAVLMGYDLAGRPIEVKSSITFFIPNEKLKNKFMRQLAALSHSLQDENQKALQEDKLNKLQYEPLIGYACCSCRQCGLQKDQVHMTKMATMFKAVLNMLSAHGYKTVKVTSKLCKSPLCLSRFINDADEVTIVSRDDANREMTIKTMLPHL